MTRIRSFLFTPADSTKKIETALKSGADAVILDFEDSVATNRKAGARTIASSALAGSRPCQMWVRINPLQTEFAAGDLAAIVGVQPDGIVLPKARGPEDVLQLSGFLDRADPDGRIKIMPIATEIAEAPFRLGDYAKADIPRLFGLTWGAEDLAAELGANTNRDPDGELSFTYKMVRSMCLLAARAAGVEAIETLYADYKDEKGLATTSIAAFNEGFSARLAIHPAQVAPINDGFLPSAHAVKQAKAIVEAFASAGGAGTVGLNGKMLDAPHLRQAERLIELATSFKR